MEQKQRKSPCAQWYDYTSPGGYFVTICTKDHAHYFGEIQDGQMILNQLGQQTKNCRNDIPNHHPYADIHEFICMPNHIHGIVIIRDQVGTQNLASKSNSLSKTNNHSSLQTIQCQSQSLGSIIRGYKIGVTKYAREHDLVFAWQGRYHDHIIRNEGEYERIKYYIQTNPQNRKKDKFHDML